MFCLGIRAALREVADALIPGEEVAAYLDDIYVACSAERLVPIFSVLRSALMRHAGISLNDAKTRVWNSAGQAPPGVHTLGPEAWSPDGVVILGTPVGKAEFVERKLEERFEKLKVLTEEIVQMDDPQEAWQLLVRCVVPRMNHTLRTLPPNWALEHEEKWDAHVCESAIAIEGATGMGQALLDTGQRIAQLPCRMGGLRGREGALRSLSSRAARTGPNMVLQTLHADGSCNFYFTHFQRLASSW